MESPALAPLRRDVRRLVHRTCRQRIEEGDEAGAQQVLDAGLADLLATSSAVVDEATMREWIAADEADFDRAMLISDLIASRIGPASAPEKAPPRPRKIAAAPASETPARSRPASADAPGIADMLDDMLTQQRPARSA